MTTADETNGRRHGRRFNPDRDVAVWHGKYLPYDLVKEFLIALVVVTLLVVLLAVVFSSPDDHPVTVRSWSTAPPIDTANDYVIAPLQTLPDRAALDASINAYTSASSSQQANWTTAYEKAVADATFAQGGLKVPSGAYGPVAPMISALTSMARSGALDGALLSSRQFYGTDYTKPLLFIADGTYLANLGQAQHLQGS